jgi:hypothetical protein
LLFAAGEFAWSLLPSGIFSNEKEIVLPLKKSIDAKVVKLFQTEITDKELYALILKYGEYHWKVLTYKYGYDVEKDDVIGELAVKACEAKLAFEKRKTTTANIKTFIITAMNRRMQDYRKHLDIRQRKYPMLRILEC